MSLKPLYDNIVVRPIQTDDTTTSGIILSHPDLNKEYSEGVVITVGEGYRTADGITPLTVNVGDIILYRKMVEIMVMDGGEELFIVSENNIFAIKS